MTNFNEVPNTETTYAKLNTGGGWQKCIEVNKDKTAIKLEGGPKKTECGTSVWSKPGDGWFDVKCITNKKPDEKDMYRRAPTGDTSYEDFITPHWE